MKDLADVINPRVGDVIRKKFSRKESFERLSNEVITEDVDIEHVITFLDQASSQEHRRFADELRQTFERSLRDQLRKITKENPEVGMLYAGLIDMHEIEGLNEQLVGILTLNYDLLLEDAIENLLKREVDFGINLGTSGSPADSVRVLKLHGSFGWRDCWPVTASRRPKSLWIPPGIRKMKDRYPFNLLWGLARETLDCDVLRIIGCRLSENDWDLVSLLFATRYAHAEREPYDIEIVDIPGRAQEIGRRFPYLQPKSLLEIDGIGEQIVSEIVGGDPRPYRSFSEDQQQDLVARADRRIQNPFFYWLKVRSELLYRDLGAIDTDSGIFRALMEA